RDDLLRKAVVHQLIDQQVTDVLETSAAALAAAGDLSAQEIRGTAARIAVSRELGGQKRELENIVYDRVYRHPRLIAVRSEAQERLRQMFALYGRRPEQLPPHFQER